MLLEIQAIVVTIAIQQAMNSAILLRILKLSSSNVNSSCVYTGSSSDGCSVTYAPSPTNIMSYSRKACRTTFSQGQLDRILQSYLVDRDWLDASGCCPDSYELVEAIDDVVSGVDIKYEAGDLISAANEVKNGADVRYDAGNYVELTPGFYARSGSVFEAYIDGCGGAKEQVLIALKENNNQLASTSPLDTPSSNSKFEQDETTVEAGNRLNNYPNPFSRGNHHSLYLS